jgi:nucleotide-binding universal stress UspA family protein
MIAIRNVLVATDFSEPSSTALEYGRDLARTFGATLHVVHVVQNVMLQAYAPDGLPANAAELQRELEAEGRRRLEAEIREDDRRELGARTVLLTSGSVWPAIARYAKEAAIDVIVVGTHGRTGIAHAMLGSVAERVVRVAPCPVLTVRHPEREFLAPDALQPVTATHA